jgi:hypothetical protein
LARKKASILSSSLNFNGNTFTDFRTFYKK